MAKYSLGLDFGTASLRALLVNIETGQEIATAVREYEHGVIDEKLNDIRLPGEWALQNPQDSLECMEEAVSEVVLWSGVRPENIVGIGVDATSCTILPVNMEGEPLCTKEKFVERPHAWAKLWKHHAAQSQADRMTELALERKENFLENYGGKISSEWMLPKILQVLEEDPSVYHAADFFVEAADWIVWRLTGELFRSACCAGYKAMYSSREHYPSPEYLAALSPELRDVCRDKLAGDIIPLGARAGSLSPDMASRLGLRPGTSVGTGCIDAHAAVFGCSITEPGQMVMIMGTSTCHMIMSKDRHVIPGVSGVVEDGIVPGLYGYEAGQAAVGDHFEWFTRNLLPHKYDTEATEKKISPHELLTEKASSQRPGEHGLIALDWWNGNRSVLGSSELSGVIVGMSLRTKPEDIYRALIEATAFGTRAIIETFEAGGIAIDSLYACGGLASKNQFLCQVYADVTGKEIRISASDQTSALGAAILGATAAGSKEGGYDSLSEAAKRMGRLAEKPVVPCAENLQTYDKLYSEYMQLHDYFGKGTNDVMARLRKMREAT